MEGSRSSDIAGQPELVQAAPPSHRRRVQFCTHEVAHVKKTPHNCQRVAVSTCRALPTNSYDFEALEFINITNPPARVFTAVAPA